MIYPRTSMIYLRQTVNHLDASVRNEPAYRHVSRAVVIYIDPSLIRILSNLIHISGAQIIPVPTITFSIVPVG